MNKLIFTHPTGNANARAAALGMHNSGRLDRFFTSLAVFPGGLLDRLSKISMLRELERRKFDKSLAEITHIYPWREIGRLLATRGKIQGLTNHEKGLFCIDAVYRSVDRRVSRALNKGARGGSDVPGVYAYEDGALASFLSAKRLEATCLYDLPIGYWRAARVLLDGERQRWPEWASTLTGFHDSEAKLKRKDEELRLADHIFVASSFTKKTLEYYPGILPPIEVIPYGFPNPIEHRQHRKISESKPLKLLFVGGLSQRKGIADLFAAVEAIGSRVELTVIGGKAVHGCEALDAALSRHRWIPSLPHDAILEMMRQHDVFVFPSLFEGFGLVITEAMSQGTPVITTNRTAGPDLIEHGCNGWLVEAGNTLALQSQIEDLLKHPKQIEAAGIEAIETSRRRPWRTYGEELAAAVARVMD